jgi:predicted metalloprotease with PDZ domain
VNDESAVSSRRSIPAAGRPSPRMVSCLLVALVVGAGATGCAGHASAPAAGAASPSAVRPWDIAYRIAMPDPSAHYFEIQLDIAGVDRDTVRLQMPVWSPGRYARMDFARNVQRFAASTPDGATLAWDLENGSLWRVATGGRHALRVRYRVFADNLSGTFSVLDTAHANWNGASLFVYAVDHKPDPVQLTIAPPPGWRVMNGAADSAGQVAYTFPDYDHLIDTPTEVAPHFSVDSFRVDGRLYRVMVHHNGPEQGQRARFVADVEKIVRAENRIVAPPPLDRYTFLFNIGYAGGDGMEHLYSTEIIDARPWALDETVLSGIGTAAHEYVHTWNVKRIRPIALGPFDYTREQYEPSLWVAEGWTQYYGIMTLGRTGIESRGTMYDALAGVIQTTVELPARLELSARGASFHAPFWDGAAQPTATDRNHSFISYYTKGAALAFLLDLKIRARSGGTRSLDDALRNLKTRSWDAPRASYYLQGRGYTEQDVEDAASAAYGESLHDWFERYVGGVEELPWRETLALAGLTVSARETPEGRVFVLGEAPDATPAQRAVREGWLKGS